MVSKEEQESKSLKMATNMTVNGQMTKPMVRVSFGMLTETIMKGIGLMIRHKDRDCILHQTEAVISANGSMICSMVLVKKLGLTNHTTKEIIMKEQSTERAYTVMLTAAFTMVNGLTIKLKE